MAGFGRRLIAVGALVAAVLVAAPAQAQLLGGVSNLPVIGGLRGTLQDTVSDLRETTVETIDRLHDTVGRPLSAPRHWDKDPLGAPIVRGEIVAIAPSDAALAAARRMGFSVRRSETVAPLDIAVVVLQMPDGLSPGEAMARLHAADPQGQYDFNHLYNPGGAVSRGEAGSDPPKSGPTRVGMIDGGLDAGHPVFRGIKIKAAGFVGDCRPLPSTHGTAVASLLAGRAPGTTLYAADVFCGRSDGGSAEAIARAMGWLAEAKVAVINISLAGPPNALLAAAAQAMVKRGHVVVAAVGNEGPAAGVRYPAAYPGVVAVTSVDDQNRIEIDAGQGTAVAFAARGVKVRVAKPGGGFGAATGTSFAAPVVARAFAALLERPDPAAASAAFAALQRLAVPAGAGGRNPVFGYGVLPDSQAAAR